MREEALLKKFAPSIMMFALFAGIGVVLWQALGNVFYLFNFGYIGGCIAVGLALYACKWPHARRFVQFAVGCYMLLYVGFAQGENMQIEGFWYYLFLGVFEGATIHCLVAKIAGPALFGRGWCGYACWTAMVLDLLPWRRSPGRKEGLGWIRYALLAGSLLFVGATLVSGVASERLYFVAFIVGNVAYYAVGIALAAALHDNRAFCKYICPVGVLMKPAAHLSLARVKCDPSLCIDCGKCRRACPMDIDPTLPFRERPRATECILCTDCVNACPKGALKL